MPTSNGTTPPNDDAFASSSTDTVLLEVMAEVLMESCRTSPQIKLLFW